jgi:hypothetical protein
VIKPAAIAAKIKTAQSKRLRRLAGEGEGASDTVRIILAARGERA